MVLCAELFGSCNFIELLGGETGLCDDVTLCFGEAIEQVLVVADMLGMTADFTPRFLRRYADLHTIITDAVGSYVSDVKACDFPNEKEQY